MYNEKQLTAAIKNAATVERLAQLVHTCSLNHIHIAAMFVKVVNLTKNIAQPDASVGLMSKERLQSLQVQQQLTAHLQQVLLATQCAGHCCRGLANIIWALGKLQPEPEVLSMLLQRFFSQLTSAVPQDIANVLWGIAQIVRDRRLAPTANNDERLVAAAQPGQASALTHLMQPVITSLPDASNSSGVSASEAAEASRHLYPPGLDRPPSASTLPQTESSISAPLVQQTLLSVEEVKQLLQHLVNMLHQAAPQTISNIACALCVLQHCHQWCTCTCLPEIQQIMTAFCKRIADALPSHVQKVVKCLTQLSLACSTHARQAWTQWQPTLLQSILDHVVAQQTTLKQFHMVSLLRDITQLSCLFLPDNLAAEIISMAAPVPAPPGQQQGQHQLAAAAAAATALDAVLDLHGRGFSADELDEEALALMHTDLRTSIKVPEGVPSDKVHQSAASVDTIDGTLRSPTAELVHRLVATIFSNVSSRQAAGGLSADGIDVAGQKEVEQQLVTVGQQSSATAFVPSFSSEEQPSAVAASGSTSATGKSSSLTLLHKLMPQLEHLGILEQFNALKTLCAQHGPLESGLVGPASGAVFMQPRDKTMHSRLHSFPDCLNTQRLDSSNSLAWQAQQSMQGAVRGQLLHCWDKGGAQQCPETERPGIHAEQFRSSVTGPSYQSGYVGGRSGTFGSAGAAGSSIPPASGVGRVYLQRQPWQRSVVTVQSPSTAQYPGSRVPEGPTWRHQQPQMLHQYRNIAGAVRHARNQPTDVDSSEAIAISPFQHAASLAASGSGALGGASAAKIVKTGSSLSNELAVPMASLSSSSTASITIGVSGLSVDSSSCSSTVPSGQVDSGRVMSVLGSAGGSSVSQNSALGTGATLIHPADHQLPAFAHGGQQQQQLPSEPHLTFAGAVGAQHQHVAATPSGSASGIATGISQGIVTPTASQQQPAVGVPIVFVQHGGQSLAYHQMPDGTLVPVQQQTVAHVQQQQQQLLLSAVSGMAASVTPAGPSVTRNAALHHGLVQQHASGGVAVRPGAGYAQMPQLDVQSVLQYSAAGRDALGQPVCTAAVNSPQVALHQDVLLQGTASPLADATSMLAANQVMLQQQQQQLQQQQLQQQQLQIQLQQQQLQLASGQGSQIPGMCFQYVGGSLAAPSAGEFAVGSGAETVGGATLLIDAEAARLGDMPGQQWRLYPAQSLLQQQQQQQQHQMYHVPSSTGLQ